MPTDDEETFKGKLATGMELGAMRDTGNLRILATLQDGTKVALELPQAWLLQMGGLAHFVKSNCQPVGGR